MGILTAQKSGAIVIHGQGKVLTECHQWYGSESLYVFHLGVAKIATCSKFPVTWSKVALVEETFLTTNTLS